ncbi:hypothetical protein [Anabaena sp. CA = ATCC 33047]|uniref:hypothetical protein n=1 Tax=Anabaena sp. (strain CA / ATCC 33047) TaxID=52271 RepID=UPI0008332BB0|nr:hypothetical protein [Anabaena sp. CA = ATCC 33047]
MGNKTSKLIKMGLKYGLNLLGSNYHIGILKENPCSFLDDLPEFYGDKEILKRQKLNNYIFELLAQGEPFFLGRWGTTEYECIQHFLKEIPWYEKRYNALVRFTMEKYSGFFPTHKSQFLERFSEVYLGASSAIDVMGLLGLPNEEKIISKICPKATYIRMLDIEPWLYENPWSQKLEGKRVLVVHPFAEDIKKQYVNRKFLFKNPNILPDFELKTIRAIQRNSPEQDKFYSWFEALNFMKGMIKATEFDIALLGCGAYGIPLAAFIKEELHKTAIHLASTVQLLFGLRGRRWDKSENGRLNHLFNEYWKYPTDNIGRIDPDTKLTDADVYSK